MNGRKVCGQPAIDRHMKILVGLERSRLILMGMGIRAHITKLVIKFWRCRWCRWCRWWWVFI